MCAAGNQWIPRGNVELAQPKVEGGVEEVPKKDQSLERALSQIPRTPTCGLNFWQHGKSRLHPKTTRAGGEPGSRPTGRDHRPASRSPRGWARPKGDAERGRERPPRGRPPPSPPPAPSARTAAGACTLDLNLGDGVAPATSEARWSSIHTCLYVPRELVVYIYIYIHTSLYVPQEWFFPN